MPDRLRDFSSCNAGYWIDEFHLDGLRLGRHPVDHDQHEEHVLKPIVAARAKRRGRVDLRVAKTNRMETRLARPIADGAYGLDALWNDDFHHSAMVALTGRAEAYYSDTARAAGSSSRRRIRLPVQDSSYACSAFGAAPRRGAAGICLHRVHSAITTRWRTPRAGCGAPVDEPRPWRAMTAPAAAAARHTDVVSGAGVLRLGAVPLFRLISNRVLSAAVRAGAVSSSAISERPPRFATRPAADPGRSNLSQQNSSIQ